jgi:hypothetical protein
LNIEFLPSFPAGTEFTKVSINGQYTQVASFKTSQYTSLISKFNFVSPIIFEVETDKGISVLPIQGDPKPGDPASGLRLISSVLKGDQYILELEGKPASSGTIKIYTNNLKIDKIENGKILDQKENFTDIEVLFENGYDSYCKKSLVVHLK